MNMSRRLTFSLASLILFLTLGLVFAPTSVLADDPHTVTDPVHKHPAITISATDADTATDGIQVLDTDTTATDLILKFNVTLTLENSVNLLQNDGAVIGNGTFNRSDTTDILILDDKYLTVSTIDTVALGNGTYTEPTATTAPKWEGTVTVTLIDDGQATTTDAEQVAAAIAAGFTFDLTIPSTIRANVDGGPYYDSGNTIGYSNVSTKQSFTIIDEIVLEDSTGPTVDISVSRDGGDAVFNLVFSEPLAKPTSISRLQVTDFEIKRFTTEAAYATYIKTGAGGTLIPTASASLSAPVPLDTDADEDGLKDEEYVLTVTLGADPQIVSIKLNPTQVTDVAHNNLSGTAAELMAKFDTVAPTVVITPGYFDTSKTPKEFVPALTGEPMDKLAFEFAFSEPLSEPFTTSNIEGSPTGANFTFKGDAGVTPVLGKPNAFTVIATIIDKNAPTTVQIERLEVSDVAGNKLQADTLATYTPKKNAPVASITAPSEFKCDADSNNSVTVTITDTEALKAGEAIAASEITVSKGWQIKTGSFSGAAATAGAKSVTATFKVVRNDVEKPSDRTWVGETTVTVTVKKDAVLDSTALGNKAESAINAAGPVLDIPADSYVVVVRTNARIVTHLQALRTLYLGDPDVQTRNVTVEYWECMPDLSLVFDVKPTASYLGGGRVGTGGGGLLLLESYAHDMDLTKQAIKRGDVGISEVMWAQDQGIDFGTQTNLLHAREQWIELHNLTADPVKVTLFDLKGTEAYHTVTYAHEVDRVSNYNIGGRWGYNDHNITDASKKQAVSTKGQDGNSDYGINFVAMQRNTATLAKNYHHSDYISHGNSAGDPNKWSPSGFSYLTRRAKLTETGAINLDADDRDETHNNYHFYGTPGRANGISHAGPIARTDVKHNSIVFNEIANRRDQTLEWIELKNVSGGTVNLKNYEISYVTAKGTDTRLYVFPNNDNTQILAGELLLLVDTDPRDNDNHPVAVGYNIHMGNDQALGIGTNPKEDASGNPIAHATGDAPRYMVTNFAEGGLPDDGKFVLILRNGNDKRGTHEKVIDVVGYDDNLKDDSIHTQLWPLKIWGAPDARNSLAVETVHRRQNNIAPDQTTHGDKKDEHMALRDIGYTGVGYKRHAQRIAAHGGTPGYEDTRKNLVADVTAAEGVLTISEIMYDQGDGEYPQWIEIYNSSNEPVNLHSEGGWRLAVENFDDGEIPINRLSGTLNFKNSDVQTILPQQTVIVTSTRARNSGSAFFDTRVVFPATRVFSVWDDARGELDMKRSTDPILSTKGFYIELIDGKGNLSDGVGNLVKSPNRRVAAEKTWELSEVTGEMMEGMGRSSILRRYREPKGGDSRTWKPYTAKQVVDMGVTAAGWVAAHATNFREVRETWYGHQDDIGSPGITGGRVLPVSLSKFRPERLKDTGEIVVRWITESETNNAGFNILRSETRNGEYTKLQFVAGQGTTSERTTYEWKDTTAKPNVVYYYQIQDVSLDGQVNTLKITHLRGNVSAAGKLTTTWGDLKSQD